MWTPGHELKYWRKNGIKKGNHIYKKYFDAFNLDEYDFYNKVVIDVGCGPFGGLIPLIETENGYSLDILSNEYNKMQVCEKDIIYGDLSKELPFQDNFADFIICTNAIDHINDVNHGFSELYRILKKNGILFVHVHLRKKSQLNKAHIHKITEKMIVSLVEKIGYTIHILKKDTDWVNDRDDRKALYMVLKK